MKDDMKYEDAMRELERIVARMETKSPTSTRSASNYAAHNS